VKLAILRHTNQPADDWTAARTSAAGRVFDRTNLKSGSAARSTRCPFDELVDRVAAIRTGEQPDVVASSGHDGITAHPDHIVVGAATDAALGRFAAGSAGEWMIGPACLR